MEIRYFQIIIPLISIFIILTQYRAYQRNRLSISETIIITFFWVGVTCLALFPDVVSDFIADVFGIENNINAIIFLALGVLFYLQLQMYKIIKKQDQLLTELTRKIALDNHKKS